MKGITEGVNIGRTKTREAQDCAIMSIATILGGTEMDYYRVHAKFAAMGRKPRTGVRVEMIMRVMVELGIQHDHGVTYKATPELLQPKTVKKATGIYREGKYLFFVKAHVLACVDGVVYDWTRNRHHRIQGIWRIIE